MLFFFSIHLNSFPFDCQVPHTYSAQHDYPLLFDKSKQPVISFFFSIPMPCLVPSPLFIKRTEDTQLVIDLKFYFYFFTKKRGYFRANKDRLVQNKGQVSGKTSKDSVSVLLK